MPNQEATKMIDIPVTEEKFNTFPLDLSFSLYKMGMRFQSDEKERAYHQYPYYTTTTKKRDAIIRKINMFRGDKTDELSKHVQKILSSKTKEKPRVIGKIKSDDYDWSFFLDNNWSTVECVQLIREHGLPPTTEERTKLLHLLRESMGKPTEQIPVYYEDLIAYSANFLNAYGPEVLEDIERRGNITGANFTEEVLRAKTGHTDSEKIYHEPKITAEEAELLFYVYPVNHRIEPDPTRYAITFVEEREKVRELADD